MRKKSNPENNIRTKQDTLLMNMEVVRCAIPAGTCTLLSPTTPKFTLALASFSLSCVPTSTLRIGKSEPNGALMIDLCLCYLKNAINYIDTNFNFIAIVNLVFSIFNIYLMEAFDYTCTHFFIPQFDFNVVNNQ